MTSNVNKLYTKVIPVFSFQELCILCAFLIAQVGTFASSVGMETPDQTLNRITSGNFRSYVNATTSGGGTYSSPVEEEFPLF